MLRSRRLSARVLLFSFLFCFSSLITISISSSLAFAQADILSPSAKYNSAIPTVESVLGYKIGEEFTPYFMVDTYWQKLAAASDRVTMERYGKTAEGRKPQLGGDHVGEEPREDGCDQGSDRQAERSEKDVCG